jgi:hypothetical protein
MIKIGDVFEIPLSNGHKAFGQLVYKDKQMGPLIQVFDLIIDRTVDDVQQLKDSEPLFPPVITGINAMVRKGIWKVIGNLPVENFIYPNFIRTLYDTKTGKAGIWFLWDGKRVIRVGEKLSDEHKKLEYLVVWSPFDLVERIETGKYPFPYSELINNNQFEPRKLE